MSNSVGHDMTPQNVYTVCKGLSIPILEVIMVYLLQTTEIYNFDYTSCHVRKHITKTCLCNFDPLKPQFYIVKLGFTGVYIIFLISAQKHRLWVLVRTASLLTSTHNLCFDQKYVKYRNFLSENFHFLVVKFSV